MMQENWIEPTRRAALLALCAAVSSMAGCFAGQAESSQIEAAKSELVAPPPAGTGAPGTGAPGDKCGSRGLPACGRGQFCKFSEAASCGEADVPGVCTPQPRFCPQVFNPVCGCDGRTYANACQASAAGVSVRSPGSCTTAPRACGGLLGLRCAANEYCKFAPEANCGRADATGTCERKPSACTKQFMPVCGCDGTTYGNACTAAAAGVSVETPGECRSTGEICGGLLGISCPEGQYCDFAAGDGCDVADGQGVCSDQPQICTDLFDPVCSCDGTTYGNACDAARAGASVRAPGECTKL